MLLKQVDGSSARKGAGALQSMRYARIKSQLETYKSETGRLIGRYLSSP